MNVSESSIKELLHLTAKSIVNTGVALHKDIFSIKPSSLHHKLSDALVNSSRSVVLTFPREFGKTKSVWEGFASWNVLHRRYRYVMYVATSSDKGKKALANVKSAILGHPILNNLIIVQHNTAEELQYAFKDHNGKITPFLFRVFGAGQNLRGEVFGAFRPDLIILDDLEDTESVRSKDQREKLKDWFFADVMPLGKSARHFYVGTMLHEDCLLAHLQEQPPMNPETGEEWQSFRYGILDDTGNPTWPEKYDANWIDMKRKDYIKRGMLYRFNTEYMNIAVSREDRSFSPEQVRFYGPEQLDNAMRNGMDIIMVVDPGIRDHGDHDPTVILVTGRDSIGNMWVLDLVWERLMKTPMLNHIVEKYRKWNPRQVFVEAVQGQFYLVQDLVNGDWPGGVCVNCEEIPTKMVALGKHKRIYGLQPRFERKQIMIPNAAEWWVDFQIEMTTFPRGKHDDMLDSLSYADLLHIDTAKASIDVEELLSQVSSTTF